MSATPLNQKLLAAGALSGSYSGVETPSRFSDVRSEFRALTMTCAAYDLGWRAKIIVTGRDRNRWLNGMVTNNIKDLQLNYGNYSFLLNPQGRIQGDLYAFNRGDYLLIDTDHSQLEPLTKALQRYIIMDDVHLTDATEKITAIGVQGPKSREILQQIGIDVSNLRSMQLVDLVWRNIGMSVVRTGNDDIATYELWAAVENIDKLWDALIHAGATPVGTEALERLRILTGAPKYGTDIRERDLPQETQQNHALNFSKGCYIGQEIVERIHSRGNVHRSFTGFTFTGETPSPGAKLQADGKEVGEITSIALVPSSNGSPERALGLGYIRKEALERGAKIEYSGGEAWPAKIPFPLQ
jgi:folate-binding protein YgfZ